MAKKDHKEDFLNYLDLWDKACDKNIFPKQPKLDPLPESDHDYDDPAEDYYNNIDREMSDDGLLSEDSANPVFPDSVGKDCSPHTPWVDEKAIEEIADLKSKLYDIECKLNSKDAGGEKWNKKAVEVNDKAIWKQIKDLQKRIDKLSNSFGLKEEPRASLYRTR